MADATPQVTVAHVLHDLINKRSTVKLTWDDGSDRRLFLPVPFGTDLADLGVAARKALRDHSDDIARTEVNEVTL